MKIRLIKGMAGRRGAFRPGDVIEREATEAQRLIDAGIAEAVTPKRKTARKKAESTE